MANTMLRRALLGACIMAAVTAHAAGDAPRTGVAGPNVAQWNTPTGAACVDAAVTGKQLTLLDMVDQALCNNPQTRESWANAKASAAQVGVNQADYWPSITLSTSLSRAYADGSSRDSRETQAGIGASINYLLFDFGARDARLESAKFALAAANWSHDATLQNVIFTVIQNYYQLFAARAAIDAASENEKSALQSLQAATARHEVGVATPADRLQAQTAYSQAKLTRTRAQGEALAVQGDLANSMGLEADAVLNIIVPNAQPPGTQQQQNLRELMESAKRARPDLAAVEAQVNAAQANVKAAQADGKPTISLGADQRIGYSSISDQPRSTSIGLSLNIPLFTGYRNTYQVKQAQANVEARAAQRDRLANQVTLDVWKAYQNLNTEQQAFTTAADLVTGAIESERVALGRYKAGVGSITDLLNAQAALANARFQYVQSAYNWHIVKTSLAQSLGNLHIDALRTDATLSATRKED